MNLLMEPETLGRVQIEYSPLALGPSIHVKMPPMLQVAFDTSFRQGPATLSGLPARKAPPRAQGRAQLFELDTAWHSKVNGLKLNP